MELDTVPEELQLHVVEQQLIAPLLIFFKVKKLPTSRMSANFDRIISVPIDCETVNKNISLLPRHPDDAHIVAVELKRKLEMKNSHLEQYIRPKILLKGLHTLKERGNPFFQNIQINEDFMNKENNLDDEAIDTDITQKEDQGKDQESKEKSAEEDLEEEGKSEAVLANVKEFQSKQDDFTVLMPKEMTDEVEMNHGKSQISRKRVGGKSSIQIAPGEGKVPTNILREDNFDVKAFPIHHPDGKFGLHYERPIKLSPQAYFQQRLLNEELINQQQCSLFYRQVNSIY